MILSLVLSLNLATHASIPTQQVCTPGERQLLQNSTISKQVASGKFYHSDCAILKTKAGSEMILALYTLNTQSGLVTYASVFARSNFTVRSAPEMKSPALGLEAFPISVAGHNRRIFVKAGHGTDQAVIYLNPQSGPNATKFSRWVFDFKAKTIQQDKTKTWILNAGRVPKILDTPEGIKADLGGNSVAL